MVACQAAVNERPYKYHAEHLASLAKLVVHNYLLATSEPVETSASIYVMLPLLLSSEFYSFTIVPVT